MRPRTLVGLVAFGGLLIYLLTPIGFKLHKLKKQEVALEEDVRKLASESIILKNELRLLKEDPVYVENLARRTFRRGREGEIVYRFVPEEELEAHRKKTYN